MDKHELQSLFRRKSHVVDQKIPEYRVCVELAIFKIGFLLIEWTSNGYQIRRYLTVGNLKPKIRFKPKNAHRIMSHVSMKTEAEKRRHCPTEERMKKEIL